MEQIFAPHREAATLLLADKMCALQRGDKPYKLDSMYREETLVGDNY
jgi:hypothetical protein